MIDIWASEDLGDWAPVGNLQGKTDIEVRDGILYIWGNAFHLQPRCSFLFMRYPYAQTVRLLPNADPPRKRMEPAIEIWGRYKHGDWIEVSSLTAALRLCEVSEGVLDVYHTRDPEWARIHLGGTGWTWLLQSANAGEPQPTTEF